MRSDKGILLHNKSFVLLLVLKLVEIPQDKKITSILLVLKSSYYYQ